MACTSTSQVIAQSAGPLRMPVIRSRLTTVTGSPLNTSRASKTAFCPIQVITATATDPSNNTSEFSGAVAVAGGNGVTLTLEAGGTRTTSTGGRATNVRSGYATTSVDAGVTPYGTAVFSLTQNNVVVSEAG